MRLIRPPAQRRKRMTGLLASQQARGPNERKGVSDWVTETQGRIHALGPAGYRLAYCTPPQGQMRGPNVDAQTPGVRQRPGDTVGRPNTRQNNKRTKRTPENLSGLCTISAPSQTPHDNHSHHRTEGKKRNNHRRRNTKCGDRQSSAMNHARADAAASSSSTPSKPGPESGSHASLNASSQRVRKRAGRMRLM